MPSNSPISAGSCVSMPETFTVLRSQTGSEFRVLRPDVEFGSRLGVLFDPVVSRLQRRQEGARRLRVLGCELTRRIDHVEGVRPSQDVVAAQDPVDSRVLQLLVLERRSGEMRRDFGMTRKQRRRGVRMWHADRQSVELVVLT